MRAEQNEGGDKVAVSKAPEPHFGECEGCDRMVERVGWDRICFDCQEDEREADAEREERMAEEDRYLYGI